MHFASRQWLEAKIAKIHADDPVAKIIAATHHAPIIDANSPQHRGGELAPAFVSDMRAEIEAWRPAVWAFGHTHFDVNVTIGHTRVVSRQRGYCGVDSGIEKFTPAIVEI